MSVLLLGDSHLARVRRDLHRVAAEVANRAVGGAGADDLAGQAAGLDLGTYDAVVVSVGTNDAAPWKQVPLDRFRARLTSFAAAHPGARWVVLTSPGVDESRIHAAGRQGRRSNETLATYARAAVDSLGATAVLESRPLLAHLGSAAFTADGVHLTGAAYDVLLPALAAEVEAVATSGRG